MIKMLMADKIHTQRRRRILTTEQIAEIIRRKYTKIKRIDNGLTLEEKAEQVYNETLLEIIPGETSHGNLSDLLNDDSAPTTPRFWCERFPSHLSYFPFFK